jgi:hypothetical protein
MLAVAFRRLEAEQNLTGLYVWCKEKAGKRFRWIRSLKHSPFLASKVLPILFVLMFM